LAAAVWVLWAAGSAFGQTNTTGLYFSGNLGLAFMSDSDMTDSTVPGATVSVEFDSGLALGAAVGYDFGSVRLEGELDWQQNDLDKAEALGVGVGLSGDVSIFSFLVNAYVEWETQSPLVPFVSAGIGFANVDVSDFQVPGSGLPSSSDDDTVLAWQLGAGVGYAVTPSTLVEFKYRYFATADVEFNTTEAEIASHNIYLGLRFYF
jgi:opacity protein-like surface antigen